jgi:hypothetical protein
MARNKLLVNDSIEIPAGVRAFDDSGHGFAP